MCLTTVREKLDGTVTVIESGWKYFLGTDRNEFPHSKWGKDRVCPEDKWITAIGQQDIGGYETGFHIFTDEKKAAKLGQKLRRVYFRRPIARGLDQAIDTVVAKEMYVPKNQDAWPPKG